MTVNKLQLPAKENAVQLKINEIIDNLGGGGGGGVSDVKVNNTSVVTSGVANIDLTGYAQTSNLATVATSGSYNDLSNKPTIPDTSNLANKDLSNLSTTGNSKFQVPLVSGTNIKTINNGSILGSGNITVLTSHQTIKQDGITGATVNRFGTCSTGATTANKTVSITTGTYSLESGSSVRVKFSNANTADNPTLNVSSTGAKNIFHKGSRITTGANKALLAGVCDFVYDGTQYHLVGNYLDTNTIYSQGTGISISGTTINHSNSVTAGTAGTSSATSGSSLSVPYVTYDAQGHVTASGTHTHTVTGFATTDTKNTAGSTDTSSKIFLIGATSQATNPQTYSHDTAFVDTNGRLNSAAPATNANDTTVATTKWVKDQGYKSSITSSDVTTALGYTPYNSTNPNGYTSNIGTVTSVNNIQPNASGNVSLTIPTVNNATLTIQKNGTTVKTFTANASSNVTCNITVPTKTSDITNDSGYTTNVGTVTSVNNTSPDVNGNVSLTIPTTDQTFNGASTNAQSGVAILGLLEAIYPVGAIFIGTTSTCPMSALFGTWELVAQDRVLQGSSTNHSAGTTIAAGLPNVTGLYHSKDGSSNDYSPFTNSSTYTNTSALYSSSASNKIKAAQTASSTYSGMAFLAFNASRTSSIYSDSVATVQPPAYVVNIWKRTA